MIFALKDRTLILLKKSFLFLTLAFVKIPLSSYKNLVCPPPFPPSTPPLQREKVSPPLEPIWGVLQILRYSSPPLEKSRRPCVVFTLASWGIRALYYSAVRRPHATRTPLGVGIQQKKSVCNQTHFFVCALPSRLGRGRQRLQWMIHSQRGEEGEGL